MPPDGPIARPDPAILPAEHDFAQYVRTLGRGPGRSRPLTRDEARAALSMVLHNQAEPVQIGAFLMLLRYRGEDPAEMAGLVEAARDAFLPTIPAHRPAIALDWPSYGAGRTRGAPWFLLAALALAQAGHPILMHGSNEFTRGTPVTEALTALGRPIAASPAEAAAHLVTSNFAYLPLAALCPGLDALLRLRSLLGLRSPINTAARLLNPFDAPASVDGVFHPPYIALHLGAAALLGRGRLLVVKGGGGEAERNPAKPMTAHLRLPAQGDIELALPALPIEPGPEILIDTWHAGTGPGAATARATIALAVLAMGSATTPGQADTQAAEIWAARLATPVKRTRAAAGPGSAPGTPGSAASPPPDTGPAPRGCRSP